MEFSELYRTIHSSLGPYVISESKDSKHLLIALSQVFRKIQLLKSQLDSTDSSDDDSEVHFEDHRDLTNIVADLVVFLTVENQFVRHLAGNVIVLVSEIVVLSSCSDWKCFINLLCASLELAISNTLYKSLPSLTTVLTEESNYSDIPNCIVSLKPSLANANWVTVSSIIRVLRNILKNLKHEFDDQLVTSYLDCFSSCLSNIPWDTLNEIPVHPSHDAHISSSTDPFYIFLGNLVQFFCSLVEQSESVEAAGGGPSIQQITQKISNLIPELLHLCLGNQEYHKNMSIGPYFRHKLLMLMVRLGSQIRLKHSILVSWLQLLHKYFQGLLLQTLTERESDNDDCLEGSPFLLSLCDRKFNSIDTRHIQRQAIFILLRCSFSLISLKEENDRQCICETWKSGSAKCLDSDPECCSRTKGLLELYEWLQGHLPSNMFIDRNFYTKRCINFAQSFLRLYIHEDDTLFEVLLQLCSIFHISAEQQLYKGHSKESKDDIFHHLSNIFHPVNIFHLFLAELHYDHEVLLDYLISKDTGIRCVEYLLRCLRIVCDSWHLFVEFSESGDKVFSQPSCKKSKVSLDVVVLSLEGVYKSEPSHGSKCYTTREPAFEEAKECLLSLKSSVENLHYKNLFPYNPVVLLRRLRRFQELCIETERHN